MNISLPSELEEFVRRQVAAGVYPDANTLVANALREFRDQQQDNVDAAPTEGSCPPELKALLLEAVKGPHHPMPPDYFAQLRERIRTGNKG
jgi:putative addiction module CopG family antidote